MNFSISVLVGRLAADPKHTPGKKEPDAQGIRSDDRAWTRLAINRQGNDTGVDYFNISFWGKLARVAMDHTQKGKNILVLCKPRSWSKKRLDGTWENNVDFTCLNIVLGADAKAQGSFIQQMAQAAQMATTPELPILQIPESTLANLTQEQLDMVATQALALAETQLASAKTQMKDQKQQSTTTEDPFSKTASELLSKFDK
jgi:single-stranded DNA-binding protein